MRPPYWQPAVELSPASQSIIASIKRAKLFIFLRQLNRESPQAQRQQPGKGERLFGRKMPNSASSTGFSLDCASLHGYFR
jgi:hypothetical protein